MGKKIIDYEKELSYWVSTLDEYMELDGFPLNHVRSGNKKSDRKIMTKSLDGKIIEHLLKISHGKRQNLFLLMNSGVLFILSKYNFSKDVTIGMPVLQQKKGERYINDVIAFRYIFESGKTFKQTIVEMSNVYKQALTHQNIPLRIIKEKLHLVSDQYKPLFKVISLMEGYHYEDVIDTQKPDMAICFSLNQNDIKIKVIYNAVIYDEEYINMIMEQLENYYSLVIQNPEITISEIDVLGNEEKAVLAKFRGETLDISEDENVLNSFQHIVAGFGDKVAIVHRDKTITYKELNHNSNQIAGFLVNKCNAKGFVGIYMENSISYVEAILGVQKAGCAYIPIDYDLPFERIKNIVEDVNMTVIISLKQYRAVLSKLQIECQYLRNWICLDTNDIYEVEDKADNDLANRSLWEFVGTRSVDEIEGGGWQNSYTGKNFSKLEMDEYGDNSLKKLLPYLDKKKKVLEIGCASGITMFRVAPKAGVYYATDLSQAILDKDTEYIEKNGIQNIHLFRLEASEIDQIGEGDFDIIIINSVIQCFQSYNYFRVVFSKILSMCSDKARIYIGDVMDAAKKTALMASLEEFAAQHIGEKYITKTDWSQELFFSKVFFKDLKAEYFEISSIEFTDKIYTIENELTKYRYDVMIGINKNIKSYIRNEKYQNQYGCDVLKEYVDYQPDIAVSHHDIAYVIYTSGTTGRPKGIQISHGNLENFCKWHNQYYEITHNDCATRYARIGFDASVWELFPFLTVGATIHIIPEELRLDVKGLNQYFTDHNITFSFLPTQIGEQFLEVKNHSLRILAIGGDKLHFIKPQSYKIYNNYGPTENTIITTAFLINKEYTDIPIGKPVKNIRAYVVDVYGKCQPVGVAGELIVAGKSLTPGYINNEQANIEKFEQNESLKEERVYHTGDMVRWLKDGNLEYIGRIDGQVKISAFRIEMEEIENTLRRMKGVLQAIVMLKQDDENNKFLCSYLETKEDLQPEDVKKYLLMKLPEYMIPAYIFILKEMPLSQNGKINYALLPQVDTKLEQRKIIPPVNEYEADILKSVQKVLQIEKVSVIDNFFDIGGNSIKAIHLVSELMKVYEVNINDIFLHQSVRELAQNVTLKKGNLEKKFKSLIDVLAKFQKIDLQQVHAQKYQDYINSIKQLHNESLYFNPDKYNTIFLTGATGFLGIHIVKRLLETTTSHLVLLVRAENDKKALERINRKWKHHFGEDIPKQYKLRVEMITGNLAIQYFGLKKYAYLQLAERIDCVINTAANVHHYGNYEEFSGINADIILKLTEFSKIGKEKELQHISTVGVAEGMIENQSFFLYTEDDVNIGQKADNYYTITKLLAEEYILKAREDGIHINIFRVGNLIADSESGIFQENIDSNGFYKIIRSFIRLGYAPDNTVRTMDFSFIDAISDAVVRLVGAQGVYNENFHLYNPNQISMKEFVGILNSNGFSVNLVDTDFFLEFLYDNYENKKLRGSIEDFILHTRLFSIPEETYYTLVCDKTVAMLAQLGFIWPIPDEKNVGKLLRYGCEIGFFK